jgi:hypothetical protein
MSCQGSCQTHQSNQELGFSAFTNCPYGIWPYRPEEQYQPTAGVGYLDSFDAITYPTNAWAESETTGFPVGTTTSPNNLMLRQQQPIEDPSSTDADTRQFILSIHDRVEKLEKRLETLQNG